MNDPTRGRMTARQRILSTMAGVAAIGVALSVWAYAGALHRDEAHVRDLAGFRADWRLADLEPKLQRLSGPASALAAFLATQDEITTQTLERFPFEMIEGTGGLQLLFWAPRVPGPQRAAFEQGMRADGHPDFAILAKPGGARAPERPEDEYFPVIYQKAFNGDALPFGLDATYDEQQRRAATAATAGGRPVMSAPGAVGGSGDLWATVFVPVYRTDHIPAPSERANALEGYVGGAINATMALNAAIAGTPHIVEDVYVSLGSAASAPFAVYDPASGRFGIAGRPIDVAALPGYTTLRTINFLGTRWTAAFHFAPDVLNDLRSPGQWLWLLTGLLLTSTAVAAIGVSYRGVIQAERTVSAGELKLHDEMSARARSEDAQRQMAERLQAVIDNAHDAIITIGVDGRIDMFNKAAERIFGYAPSEVIGRNVNMLMPSPYKEAHDRFLQNYLTTGQAKIIGTGREVEARRSDGSVFPIDLSVAEMNVGGSRGFIGLIRDISERKLTEAARDHLAAIVESSHDAVIGKNLAGFITSWNGGAEEIYGYTALEAVGRPIAMLAPPRLKDEIPRLIERIKRGEVISNYETSRVTKDGHQLEISLTLSPIRDTAGTIVGVSTIARDVTALNRAQRRIRELTAEMVHMSRLTAMGQLSSSLAHELNQPLTAVANYTEAARQMLSMAPTPIPPRVSELLEKAGSQADRAGQIIRRLRSFVEKGTIERVAASLNEMVQEATELGTIGTKSANIDIVYDLAPDLPPVQIDKVQIQQVVVNLVRNAVEVLRGTDRRVVTVRTTAGGDGYQEVAVADTGPGIAPDIAVQLFKPFVTTKAEGMGIGLSICRSIIEAHGGRIWAEPNPGGGTIFRFVVPATAEGASSA